jgi:hypothetical protein
MKILLRKGKNGRFIVRVIFYWAESRQTIHLRILKAR